MSKSKQWQVCFWHQLQWHFFNRCLTLCWVQLLFGIQLDHCSLQRRGHVSDDILQHQKIFVVEQIRSSDHRAVRHFQDRDRLNNLLVHLPLVCRRELHRNRTGELYLVRRQVNSVLIFPFFETFSNFVETYRCIHELWCNSWALQLWLLARITFRLLWWKHSEFQFLELQLLDR